MTMEGPGDGTRLGAGYIPSSEAEHSLVPRPKSPRGMRYALCMQNDERRSRRALIIDTYCISHARYS